MTTLATLSAEHQTFLTRIREIDVALDSPVAPLDLPGFATYLADDVSAHFGIEERALFPVLARHPHWADGPLLVMVAEHRRFHGLLEGLTAALSGNDDRLQRAYAMEIVDLLRAHFRKEDQGLFPGASRTLTPKELREVDDHAAALIARAGPDTAA